MFGAGGSGVSLADIAAVTDRNGNNDGGLGNGNGAWWVLIILLALFGGFGNNWGGNGNGRGNCGGETTVVTVPMPGYGGYGYGGAGLGFAEAAVQRGFDNQAVVSKLDGINAGICSLGYDQLAQMNSINSTVMQTGWGIQQAVNADTVANMQNTNALSRQLADCCCENRAGLADIKYAMATDTCAITTAIRQAASDIMQNDNANYRQLHDEQVAIQMEALRESNRQKDSTIQALNLAQSQSNQNQFFAGQIAALGDRLDPCPKPCYPVQDPRCCGTNWNNRGCNGCS